VAGDRYHQELMLLERDLALDALASGLELTRSAGSGRLVLVTGEAGIGKTSVVRAFAGSCGHEVEIRWGACDSLSTPLPFGPFRDIALVDPTATRESALAGAMDRLRALGGPVVMVIEDAHWADQASLDLLSFVGRRIGQVPIMLVVTYRADEVPASHPLAMVLGDLAGTVSARIALQPLSVAALAQLADADADVDPQALHQLTGGNPFFVTETLAAGGDGTLADSVRSAVLARCARVSAAGRAVLEAVSISPGGIALEVLTRIRDVETSAFDECVERGVLIDLGPVVSFRHELARLAVYEDLPPGRRQELHLAALDAIGPGEPSRLAFHAAEAGQVDLLLRYARLAAEQARVAGAVEQAASHLRLLLPHVDRLEPAARLEVVDQLAGALGQLGQFDSAIAAFDQAVQCADAIGDVVKRGELLTRRAGVLGNAGRDRESKEALDEAVAVLEREGPSVELAGAYAAVASGHMLAREFALTEVWAQRAIGLAIQVGAGKELCYALIQSGAALLLAGDEHGLERIEEGVSLASDEGWHAHVALGLNQIGSGAGEIRRYDLAVPGLREAITFGDQHEQLGHMRYAQAWLARCLLEQGEWDEASEIVSRLVRSPRCSGLTRITALTVLGRLRARRGDPNEREPLEEAWDLARGTGHLQRLWPAAAALAEAAWLSGRLEGEREALGQVLELATELRYPWAVGELALWARRSGDIIPDAVISSAAEPWALQLTGRHVEAAAEWDRIGCPFEAALARTESDDVVDVRAGLDLFDRLGARPAVAYASDRLRALGARVPSESTLADPHHLTAREAEVAGLVAEGLTNAEIGARLYISTKTAGHHVSSVLAKLGVSSRRQVAAARRPG
jgi:DNA-binding CsgD family transcriptional regulator/tetratricopeptide (TPR) repeat protein